MEGDFASVNWPMDLVRLCGAVEDGKLLGEDTEYGQGKWEAKEVVRITYRKGNLDKR